MTMKLEHWYGRVNRVFPVKRIGVNFFLESGHSHNMCLCVSVCDIALMYLTASVNMAH